MGAGQVIVGARFIGRRERPMKPQFHAKNLRRGRFSQAGQIYELTLVTENRRHVFNDFMPARHAVRSFYSEAVSKRAKTLAFVVMPDHVHWLMELETGGTLSEAVRIYRAKVSLALGGPIWQKGFYDRAMRSDEDIVTVARYIIANPVRAGLVRHVGEYPHWDAVWL